MDKEVNSLGGPSPDKPDSKPKATSERKTKKRSQKKKQINPTIATLIVAAIGALATIIAALIPIYAPPKPQRSPMPTVSATTNPSWMTVMIETNTPLFTDTPIFYTDTPSPTILSSLTSTAPLLPSETITPSPTPKLIVLLTANKTSGHAPLKAKFDARQSYLTAYDGQRYVCRYGPCNYVWKVYSNEEPLGKAKNGSSGTFDYTFGKRGIYKVTVWICRGPDAVDCGGGSIQITVE